MKAAVCREFGKDLIIEEISLAQPGANEILVKISATAICHSDIHFAEGAWGGVLPAIYGHESAGIIEQVGPGNDKLKVGDHVVVTLIRSCGHCSGCSRGAPVTCDTRFPLDIHGPITSTNGEPIHQAMRTGGFAEYVVVDSSQVAVIPKHIPLASASLLACGVLTGFGAVSNTAQVEIGSHVVVIGVGGVGLNAVQGARVSGAQSIIAVDISDSKLEAAKSFGATDVINSSKESTKERVFSLTGGRGADYVFVTVGAKQAFDSAYSLLTQAGTVVLVGIPATGVKSEFDIGTLAFLGQKIIGSKMGSARIQIDIPILVSLYEQGLLKLDELITKTYPLEQINQAIADVKNGSALRNVIVFD